MDRKVATEKFAQWLLHSTWVPTSREEKQVFELTVLEFNQFMGKAQAQQGFKHRDWEDALKQFLKLRAIWQVVWAKRQAKYKSTNRKAMVDFAYTQKGLRQMFDELGVTDLFRVIGVIDES